LTRDLDRYLAAVKKFNDLVSELANKLEQISDARDEALKASADLHREMESTNQKLQDVSAAVRQQITFEFTKKTTVRKDDVADHVAEHAVARRVS